MEQLVQHPTHDHHEALLRQFCNEAETLIAGARSRKEAVAAKERLCLQFEKECASSLVITGTRAFADQLIERIWNDEDADQQKDNGGRAD
jgi:hypothetical protein